MVLSDVDVRALGQIGAEPCKFPLWECNIRAQVRALKVVGIVNADTVSDADSVDDGHHGGLAKKRDLLSKFCLIWFETL